MWDNIALQMLLDAKQGYRRLLFLDTFVVEGTFAMRILHIVESYFPSLGGMAEVVRQLSERMVQRGHSVDVFTSKTLDRDFTILNGVHLKEFDISGNYVNGVVGADSEISFYFNAVLNGDYDVIVLFAAQQWSVDLLLPRLGEMKAKKIFVPTGFSGLFHPSYQDYFNKMKSWIFNFDLCVFLSSNYRDIDFVRQAGFERNIVIPNGADEHEFLPKTPTFRKKYNIAEKSFLILHVGSHTNQKGHKELFKIFGKLKRKDIVLCIIGNPVSRRCSWRCKINATILTFFSRKRVLLLNIPRSEVVTAFQESDLFLFPSNIECSPIVLYEACAAKTPFMATDVGNSVEIASKTGGGEILTTFKDSSGNSYADINSAAEEVQRLIDSPEKMDLYAKAGYESWKSKYTWEQISILYEKAYTSVL